MTVEIILVLTILGAAVILFVSEKLPVDVVALMVLGGLVVTGLVTPEQAISGFSNPAVVTVWAVFILSGGLGQTGIANQIGKYVLQLAGESEARLLVVIMLTAGVLSAFMNNIGVAAMMLPVVLDIGRKTKRPPSKLLLPLVLGALLGGTLSLIGTPPNIIISDALRDAGFRPFAFFDYTPSGLLLLLSGIIFVIFIGRYLLPNRDPVQSVARPQNDLNGQDQELYGLREELAEVLVPPGNGLAGKTLAESRIGRALGLNILAVMRNGRKQLAPQPETILQEGDNLLVLGRLDRLEQLSHQPNFLVEEESIALEQLLSGPISLAEFKVTEGSAYSGKTLAQLDIRRALGVNVMAVRRGDKVHRHKLPGLELREGDWLVVQGERTELDLIQNLPDFRLIDKEMLHAYELPDSLLVVRIPEGSPIMGKSLAESHLGQTFGLKALSLIRDDQVKIMPGPDIKLMVGDGLIVEGTPRDLAIVRFLQELVINRKPSIDLEELTTGPVALVEAVLSPFSTLANKTLQELNFRERYGLNVVAVWRGGQVYRSNLGDMALKLGDALLLYGPRNKINLLGRDPNFLVLHEEAQEELRLNKAPIAGLLMLGVIITVLVGWLPISIAAVIGATLMVITGCLEMEEAYRFIEWKAVFLIAGMLPLGIAMEETGAAAFLAERMVDAIGILGPRAILGGLFILSVLATIFMPNPVVAVLMAPVALSSAADLGITPYAFMISIAFGSSASFLSPVGHPANVLVMGPGGYRFTDYIKVGLPLVLILLVVIVTTVPIFWPFATG